MQPCALGGGRVSPCGKETGGRCLSPLPYLLTGIDSKSQLIPVHLAFDVAPSDKVVHQRDKEMLLQSRRELAPRLPVQWEEVMGSVGLGLT